MSIENYSLSKGERLSLEKEGKLTKITFRCGWDEVANGLYKLLLRASMGLKTPQAKKQEVF